MRLASPLLVLVFASVVACSRFDEAPDAPEAGISPGMDGSTDGGGSSGDGGPVAIQPPDLNFCMTAPAAGKALFCADFDASGDLKNGWSATSDYTGAFMTSKQIGTNRVAAVFGDIGNGARDRLGSKDLVLGLNKTFDLEMKIFLGAALSNVEIAIIDSSIPLESPILYLSGDQLKIRFNSPAGTTIDDSPGRTLALNAWSKVVLTVSPTSTTLTVNGGSADTNMMKPIAAIAGTTASLSVGVYYKQDEGKLDFALDDIRLIER
jgi:hypothetical protein